MHWDCYFFMKFYNLKLIINKANLKIKTEAFYRIIIRYSKIKMIILRMYNKIKEKIYKNKINKNNNNNI